jgi:hypothetical protein
MVDHIKPEHDKVANATYTGNAMAPLQELQQSQRVYTVAGGELTAGLGLTLNIADPAAAPTAPRNDHSLNT